MKTDFNIIWLEDNPNSVRGDVASFTRFFTSKGIILRIDEILVDPDFCIDQNFKSRIENPNIDLMLIDYNMSIKGSDIINEIRKNHYHFHVPIIFYSSETDIKEIFKKLFNDSLDNSANFLDISDGVYYCRREDIFVKTEKIIQSFLYKEEQVQRIRGLLLEKVSEIDFLVICKLNEVLPNLKNNDIEKIKNKITNKLNWKIKKISSELEKITNRDNDSFDTIKNSVGDSNNLIYDSHLRADILREVFRHLELTSKGEILSDFYNVKDLNPLPLSKLRNEFAHKTENDLLEYLRDDILKYIREQVNKQINNLNV